MTKFRKQYGFSDNEAIKKGLILAGIPESQIDISRPALVGYSTDVGPIAITPLAIIGVRQHI